MKTVFLSFFLILSISIFASGDDIRILHTKIIKVTQGQNIILKANVINAQKVNYIIVHYKNIKDKNWSEKEMMPQNGFYTTKITPNEMGKVGILYYIEIIDINEKSINAFASKKEPQYIDIIENEHKNIKKIYDEPNNKNSNKTSELEDEFAIFLDEEEEKVVTASKYSQSRASAPANITVVTQKDIKEYGYHSLIEILRDNGFDVNDNGSWPDVGLRGINDRTTYGKYLLIFIDGHNMSFTQFYRNIISKALISLEDIQKIEIQKGPGSSIWGANALLGVINIVTKKDNSKNSLTTITGTHNTFSSHVRIVKNINKSISVIGSLMTYKEDVSHDMVIKEWSEVAGKDITINGMSQNSYTFLGKLKLWDFKLISYYNRYDPYASITTFSVGGDDTRLVTDRFFNSLNYDKEFLNNKDFSFSVNLTLSHDRYKFANGAQYESKPYDKSTSDCTNKLVNKKDANGNPIIVKDQDGNPLKDEDGNIIYQQEIKTTCGKRFIRKMVAQDDRYEAKLYTTIGIKPINTTILGGFDYEYLKAIRWYYPEVFTKNNINIPRFSQNNMGIFVQTETNLFKIISLVLGARYDKNSIYAPQLSPKASIVLTPGNFFLKAIWGQGFKAPSLHELYYFRKNAYYGNPNLDPETSNSIEAQIGYIKRGFLDLELTFFKTGIDNVISYNKKANIRDFDAPNKFPESQLPDASYNQQANKNEYKTMGLELYSKLTINKELYFTLRGGYNIAQKDIGNNVYERLNYGQQYYGFMGINYRLFKKYNFNITGRYTSDKLLPKKIFKEDGNPNNPTEDTTLSTEPYFVMNFSFLAEDIFVKGFNISLKIDDLTNQRYYDAGREVLYPHTTLRIWTALQYKF